MKKARRRSEMIECNWAPFVGAQSARSIEAAVAAQLREELRTTDEGGREDLR